MMLLAAVLMGLTLTACNQNKQTTNDDMNTTFEWSLRADAGYLNLTKEDITEILKESM